MYEYSSAYMYVHLVCAAPLEACKVIEPSGTGAQATVSCMWELIPNPGPLQERPVVLTAGPFPPLLSFKSVT